MALLTLHSVSKDFGIKPILKNASFSLAPGDKVGLIGTNGSGKSTLLKMMAGLESIDTGEMWTNSAAKIVYLPQQPDLDDNLTVLEQVFADSGEAMALVREYEAVSHQLAHQQGDPEPLMARLSNLSQRIEGLGAWELETQAKIVLTRLGIQDIQAQIRHLSGGYRKRIALAAALLSDPDVLLMDEPTNHLDALSVEWLQDYLSRYRGALLLITHDRYFLDRVTNRILEIDQGDLYHYAGNYAYYLEKKAEATISQISSQHKHTGVLRRELEWLKRGPKARSTKQKARIERIRAMQNQEFKQVQGKVEITTAGRRIGKKVIEIHNISKSFVDRTLIHNFSYLFHPEDRIGIIGPNGVGKSTLMDMITQKILPDSGQIEVGSTIQIGYFNQHSDELHLNPKQRVIDYLKSIAELVKTADGSVITASQMLERFLFPPNQQYAPIEKLSGGEKRRLFLLQVLMSAPNVLILDEPTNDLDVQTLAVLEDYLEDFNGCVIVVSHDRYFLDRTVDTIFAFESDGYIRQYPGNYSIYLDYQQTQVINNLQSSNPQTSSKLVDPEKGTSSSPLQKTVKPVSSGKLSYKEKREYEALEIRIPEMEAEKARIEATLYDHPPTDYTELQTLSQRLAELSHSIDSSTERWMELAERDP
ncbi:MAG: ABC-F family ATP-binding cassette domain-containing protein [Cyanobacteriota bacterium]|nr:ABC-F family ATP-binding cassette domain-containing protein [Cyanobacteriota bacterium]